MVRVPVVEALENVELGPGTEAPAWSGTVTASHRMQISGVQRQKVHLLGIIGGGIAGPSSSIFLQLAANLLWLWRWWGQLDVIGSIVP